ncbi:MAG: SDR family oxidoreductase [Rikenellaceae bacterium]|nr:SDR family oxidoreductase [Rikenellaceae bacterium]
MVTEGGGFLAGKRCFVTGGANGIGREIVRAFAQEGALVFFCDRDAAGGRRLEDRLGHRAFYEVDVTDAAALGDAVRDAAGPEGVMDILVNNVGISEFSPLLETDVERFDRVIATNLRPVFVTSRVFAELWYARFGGMADREKRENSEKAVAGNETGSDTESGKEKGFEATAGNGTGMGTETGGGSVFGTDAGPETGGGSVFGTDAVPETATLSGIPVPDCGGMPCGRIINIASTRWAQSEPGSEGYAASKGGIVSLTHALAASLSGSGVTVNCISPGWIETGDYGALSSADHAQHPSGRVGRPGDIARVCLMLADPRNGFIDGDNIVVDGGMTRKMIYI